MSMVTNANPTEWLAEMRQMEVEGERTPAQGPETWDEWDEYEEAGPMDLEDQLDRLLEQL